MRVADWLEELNDKILEAIDRFGMLLAVSLVLLALVGEIARLVEPVSRAAEHVGLGQILGWWNDLGLVMTVLGVGIGLWTAWRTDGQQILELLGVQHGFLVHLAGKQDAMLESQDAMLGKQDAILDKQDRTIDVLDRIQQILDARLPGGT